MRFFVFALGLALVAPAALAQGLGRSEILWRTYLSETVRRGITVGSASELRASTPRWPGVDRALAEASSLDPGPDTDLVAAWVNTQEGDPRASLSLLQSRWPRPQLVRFSPRQWAESLFDVWDPEDGRTWTKAWLAWEEKAYSPRALVRGLEVLEATDPSAVGPLLTQARGLYPEDRRFLPLALRHPDVVPQAVALTSRDRVLSGGWSSETLASLVDRKPEISGLLIQAGYPASTLDGLGMRNYRLWLTKTPTIPSDGPWSWDADGDGVPENRLVFAGGKPLTWTHWGSDGSLWTLGFDQGLPMVLTQWRHGTSWNLRYEGYPLARSMEYRWGTSTLVYRFPPLEVSSALWPAERLQVAPAQLPVSLGTLWLPLDPRLLAAKASAIETWEAGIRTQTVLLYQGQAWAEFEDTNRDGVDDRWSYFRSGALASVYSNLEGRGEASLREVYRKGELTQVQARRPQSSRVELAIFPTEGVQLWDPHGQGRPLDRIFQWTAGDRVDAMVFTGSTLPWETMPAWEPRP